MEIENALEVPDLGRLRDGMPREQGHSGGSGQERGCRGQDSRRAQGPSGNVVQRPTIQNPACVSTCRTAARAR